MPSETLTCKNLQDYLKTLSRNVLERLFNSPATCLAVFRELPPLSQHFINRMLFVGPAVSQVLVASWIPSPEPGGNNKAVVAKHKEATQVLTEMHIWKEVTDRRGNPAYILNITFADNLKVAMLGGGKPWCMSSNLLPDPHQRTPELLDQYASERWESVLQFLVQPQDAPKAISYDAIRTLLHAKLIEGESEMQRMNITSTGFQFLLLDRSSQVWYFILKYLETVSERGLSLISCLQFLFKLSFATLGKDYSMEGMDEELQTFLQHLREFGFVFLRRRSSGRFYPTRLVLNITSGEKKTHRDDVDGNLVVETNSRVYAYSPSPLQVSLLAIFCDVECRFPNMVVCSISRQSVRRAFLKGITAEQIINYLKLHAHKQMTKTTPIIPKTVSEQIQLWELERERLEYSEGVLYKDFILPQDFSLLANYAKSRGVLIYADSKSRTLVVSKKGHPVVKQFWKETQTK